MPVFGKNSLKHRSQMHPDLQLVFDEAIKTYNLSLLCGHRNKEDQNKAFSEGFSKVQWPNSRHNIFPSEAGDAAPYPLDWKDIAAFKEMAKHVKAAAKKVNVEIEWGGDWKTFKDYPHFQLKRPVRKL